MALFTASAAVVMECRCFLNTANWLSTKIYLTDSLQFLLSFLTFPFFQFQSIGRRQLWIISRFHRWADNRCSRTGTWKFTAYGWQCYLNREPSEYRRTVQRRVHLHELLLGGLDLRNPLDVAVIGPLPRPLSRLTFPAEMMLADWLFGRVVTQSWYFLGSAWSSLVFCIRPSPRNSASLARMASISRWIILCVVELGSMFWLDEDRWSKLFVEFVRTIGTPWSFKRLSSCETTLLSCLRSSVGVGWEALAAGGAPPKES